MYTVPNEHEGRLRDKAKQLGEAPAFAGPEYSGISVRETVAAAVLVGLVTSRGISFSPEHAASQAVAFADALLVRLANGESSAGSG